MEIHLDNQVYFKCWHWALLSRIHVQAQNFQQQQEQSNGDSQEVNLKAAEQFGEVTVPFSPRVLKHKFIVWRVLGVVGFCLFTFLATFF